MSAPIPAEQFKLAIARSDLVDEFARAEMAVRRKLASWEMSAKSTLAQNLEALGKRVASPQYSKKDKASFDAALVSLRELQSIRCDLVHGTMSSVVLDGQKLACFVNAQSVAKLSSPARLMSVEQMRDVTKQVKILADLIWPPSSIHQ